MTAQLSAVSYRDPGLLIDVPETITTGGRS